MADANTHPQPPEPTVSDIRLVIAASSAGTIFEWYDFFIYGALGVILSKTFFPTGNATLEMLLFWLVFAVGLVLMAEIFNTAIESLARAPGSRRHPRFRDALDMASAAVLLAAITAAVIGVIVFGSRLLAWMAR